MHGSITNYIQNNHTNRLVLVRGFTFTATPFTEVQQQLHGAAQGLEYIHSAGLAHGRLSGVGTSLLRGWFVFNT